MGKGSKKRPEDFNKISKHWDEINWSNNKSKKYICIGCNKKYDKMIGCCPECFSSIMERQ